VVSRNGTELETRAARVRLVLTDCDGVLTDGSVYCSERGEHLVRFSRRDGMGVARLRNAGIVAGIISSEPSEIVRARATKLRVAEIHLGVADKLVAARAIGRTLAISLEEMAFIGDDVNDLDLLTAVGLSGAPRDAEPQVLAAVHYRCARAGGAGAFREFAELVLGTRVNSPNPELWRADHVAG
jgi:3-deoxy-D-manno-octulosonate 8-phosphate phosphatase (KDO 8-P phosphatase)